MKAPGDPVHERAKPVSDLAPATSTEAAAGFDLDDELAASLIVQRGLSPKAKRALLLWLLASLALAAWLYGPRVVRRAGERLVDVPLRGIP